MQTTQRYAVVTGKYNSDNLATIQRYLPSNYEAFQANPVGESIHAAGMIWIVGVDFCGWTLDDYVLPRLRSGNIAAVEVMEDATPIREFAVYEGYETPSGDPLWIDVADSQLDALSRYAESQGFARYDSPEGMEMVWQDADGNLCAVFTNSYITVRAVGTTMDREV